MFVNKYLRYWVYFDCALKFSLNGRGTPDLKLKTKQLEALRTVVQDIQQDIASL